MGNKQRIANLFLIAGFVLCVVQIWLPAYYLTGDGPCHAYNAQILHDLWAHKNEAFYTRFYEIVKAPNPNWMSHLALALLLFVVNGVVAEKILLSCYVLLFTSGFYALLKRLDNRSLYWPLVIYVFVFHSLFAKGFYNFSISIGFLLWLTEVWLRYLEGRRPATVILFFLLTVLTFFAHPMAFAFGCLACFALTLTYMLSGSGRHVAGAGKIGTMGANMLALALCALPCGYLFTRFTRGEGGGGIHLHLNKYRLLELTDMNYLVTVTQKEAIIVKAVALVLFALLLWAFVTIYRWGFRVRKYDGFIVCLAFAAFLYQFFPDKIFGGSLLIARAEYLMAVFAVCCIGYMLPPGRVKNIAGLVLFGCFIALSFERMQCRKTVSEGVADILSASKYIRPYTVVLPLDFAPGGSDASGNVITDRNWVFGHAWQYMGAEKPLILLDNYEANTGYFPLVWKDAVNPYHHLCTNGAIEAQPPNASIGAYENKTGVTIDYILMWCYNSRWLQDDSFRKLYGEINAGYHAVYVSPTGRTILYEKQGE